MAMVSRSRYRTFLLLLSALVVATVGAQQAGPKAGSSPATKREGERKERPRHLPPERPEFQPGGAERGDADEPTIAEMGADWSHEVELRAVVDRHEFRQLQRIHVKCDVKNVSGQGQVTIPAIDPGQRYLRMRVRVFDPKGHLVPMTEFYKHEGRTSEPRISGGGNTLAGFLTSPFRIDVIPNIVYDMTRPGEYWILVEMALNAAYPPESKGWFYVRANPIKVRVTPERFRAHTHEEGNVVINPDRP
jgi:hypothetical protein